jgi:hypothetical protein
MVNRPAPTNLLGTALSNFGPAIAQAFAAHQAQQEAKKFNEGINQQVASQGGIQTPESINTTPQAGLPVPQASPLFDLGQLNLGPFGGGAGTGNLGTSRAFNVPQITMPTFQSVLGQYSPWPR